MPRRGADARADVRRVSSVARRCEDYCDLLDTIAELDLVDHVAPIQLAIRLLVPEGSRLLELPELRAHLGAFDPATLAYPWTHADPRVDALHRDVTALVGTRLTSDRRASLRRDSSARARARRVAAPGAGRRRLRGSAVPERAVVLLRGAESG